MWWILLLGALIGLGFYFFRKDSQKITGCLNALAIKYKGTVKKLPISYPQLSFIHQRMEYVISAMASSTNTSTNTSTSASTFIYFYPDTKDESKLMVQSKSMQTTIDKMVGVKQYEVENPAFNEEFVVKTDQQELIQQLITPQIQEKMLSLRTLAPCGIQYQKVKFFDGEFWVEKQRCMIDIEKISTRLPEYEQLIELAYLLQLQLKK